MTSQLTVLDERKLQLQQGNPGWQIWYVPKAVEKGAVWCARPLPLLNANSPEELQELIDQAGNDAADRLCRQYARAGLDRDGELESTGKRGSYRC